MMLPGLPDCGRQVPNPSRYVLRRFGQDHAYLGEFVGWEPDGPRARDAIDLCGVASSDDRASHGGC
jgi:hypothetical protein